MAIVMEPAALLKSCQVARRKPQTGIGIQGPVSAQLASFKGDWSGPCGGALFTGQRNPSPSALPPQGFSLLSALSSAPKHSGCKCYDFFFKETKFSDSSKCICSTLFHSLTLVAAIGPEPPSRNLCKTCLSSVLAFLSSREQT